MNILLSQKARKEKLIIFPKLFNYQRQKEHRINLFNIVYIIFIRVQTNTNNLNLNQSLNNQRGREKVRDRDETRNNSRNKRDKRDDKSHDDWFNQSNYNNNNYSL